MVRVLPQQGSLWIRPDLACDRCAASAAKEIDAINNGMLQIKDMSQILYYE